jgi:hypothetical protein
MAQFAAGPPHAARATEEACPVTVSPDKATPATVVAADCQPLLRGSDSTSNR